MIVKIWADFKILINHNDHKNLRSIIFSWAAKLNNVRVEFLLLLGAAKKIHALLLPPQTPAHKTC
jgi:hypothetical protein